MQSMDSDAGEGLKMQSPFDHRRLLNAATDFAVLCLEVADGWPVLSRVPGRS